MLLRDFGQVYDNGEVVAVSVEVTARCVSALGVAFVLATALLEEVFVENFRLEVFECRAILANEIARDNDLVKQVPLSLVAQRAVPC